MIVNINPRGHSFAGVSAYLMHDKGADTSERVMWSSTHNLHTDDIVRASRFMAWTDLNRESLREDSRGSKAHAGNVYHYSLSRDPDAPRGEDWMAKSGHGSVAALKLDGHQYYLVAHSDTDHEHVHVVVNLAHPETGKIARIRGDYKTLDRWANGFESEHGIECEERAKKYEAWDKALEEGRKLDAFKEKTRKAEHGRTVSEAFQRSDSGHAFKSALESEGLALARGNRRGLVVVDSQGEIYALNRLVDLGDGTTGRAKTKIINDRLKALDRDKLQMADTLAAERKSFDRDAAEITQQKALVQGAEKSAEAKLEQEKREADAAVFKRREQRAARDVEVRKVGDRKRKDALDVLTRKGAESRSRWQIDELTKARDQAKRDVQDLRGFWARVFKRKQITEAKDRRQNLEKQLSERTARYEADLKAYQRQREELGSSKANEAWQSPPPSQQEPTPQMSDEEQRRAEMRQAFLDRIARARQHEQERDQGRDLERD